MGGGAIILPGLRIGSRAVIDADSGMTRDAPEGAVAAGNPCRLVREITEEAAPRDAAYPFRCSAGSPLSHTPWGLSDGSESHDDRGDEHAGQMAVSPLVVPGGYRAEVLEPIDAALYHVSAPVRFRIERRRPVSARAPGPPMVLCILPLGTDAADAPAAREQPAVGHSCLGWKLGHGVDRRGRGAGPSWSR